MTVYTVILDRLDTLLHASARDDLLTAARHRAFIGTRLIGSLIAFAVSPIYLVIVGAPTLLDLAAFAWLVAPILASYYLSWTGRYAAAHVLSLLSLAGLVVAVSALTGRIDSFVAVWLVLIPFEAALAGSRRILVFASLLTVACVGALLSAEELGLLVLATSGSMQGTATSFGLFVGINYAFSLAFGAHALADASGSLLSDEEERYRLLARNMSDAISRHRADGTVVFISPAAETLLGASSARLIGHGLFDRVHVADRPAYLRALTDAARGEAGNVEFRIRRETRADRDRRMEASFVWVELRCQPLDRASAATNGPHEVVAVMRDISDRKRQEEALVDARAEADRADIAKDRFLATMSHELRTPLNAIIGFSDMILQEEALRLDAARRHEYAQLINDSGQHLLSVVNGILDLSKMEAGKFEIAPEPFAPRPTLSNCCSLLALKAKEHGIELVTRAADDLPLVNGDQRAFRQIVLNLVSNAIKFTDRGGTVNVSIDAEGPRIVLRVIDNGIGIAEGDLANLGDPFFQAGQVYKRRHEGTGLGLSIVKSLVSLHGGDINVESGLGKGTTVTVSLPIELSLPRADNITLLPARAAKDEQVKKSA